MQVAGLRLVLNVSGVDSEKGHLWCSSAVGNRVRLTTLQSHKVWSICQVVSNGGTDLSSGVHV